ncbi:2,3-dihydroxybenzoate-AMP ligase [Rhodococcus sp. 05-2255-3B1]|uniref:(2,3-dihydroxybenzoyl)adenylate synthase n=1 Tax=unclassified Rhodococcus (in: high G+C Gram-positive bacteria) TaxID=192944 RepID=UPI000B9C4F6E|nr:MULTISPECIES: AMP-binding protein [unclassified Rhodococcus (in: high G+C Gram-positive bacteria)]OZE03352.1 2,3-dihydroxybenzoate-AMP ligase [Rhodococcus sp. 05-2255-3C]OZE09739.1 2,3-dihydroxybenzoate-AMP ligase [Rhodococcus sp. 05-2255-3B1]OZE15006.1 2,3-dihydroxybenzoate-AMP ligase [Rhodococcus sp. 05-2255-2A2]
MTVTTEATHSDWDGRLVRYPQDRAQHYLQSGSWSSLPTSRRFRDIAVRYPDRPAVISAEGSMTFAELDRRTDAIAAGLVRLGLLRLDPVLFQLTNRLETVLAWYGCLKAGLVPVATLAAHRMHEIAHIGAAVGAVAHVVEAGLPSFDLVSFAHEHAAGSQTVRHVVTVGGAEGGELRLEDLGQGIDPTEARAVVEAIEAETDPEDVVAFQLSGGTTGVPKVIPRIHAEYWNNALMYAQRLEWTSDSRVAHLIPIVHNAGIACGLHASHSVGACLVLATADVRSAFDLMERAEATEVLIGHGHYQAVSSPEFDRVRERLRHVILSGAKVSPALMDRVDDGRDHWAGQLFGMSEGLLTVTPVAAPRDARIATVGTPVCAEDEVRILDPGTEIELPDGEVGELCCRGPYTITGYFGAPEHNRTAFTSDGFYRTGDLASISVVAGERYVTIEGRIKDLINRGGEKINAEEVELLLLDHPAVRSAAVVAMPDPRLGEKTCAYLVTDGVPLTMADVQEHLTGLGVAKFKWPERLEWVDELPRTNVNKIDKKRLRLDIAAKLERQR